MLMRALTTGLMFFAIVAAANADATIPTKDIPNARDNQLLKRYDGSFIVSYERLAFTDFKVPLSKLERTGDSDRDRMNNQVYKPKKEIEVEEKDDADLAAEELEVEEEAEENPDDEVDLGGDDDIGVPGAGGDEEEV